MVKRFGFLMPFFVLVYTLHWHTKNVLKVIIVFFKCNIIAIVNICIYVYMWRTHTTIINRWKNRSSAFKIPCMRKRIETKVTTQGAKTATKIPKIKKEKHKDRKI